MRSTDLCFLTEVWQKSENKKHQECIESMFELKGIKYVSTPRPGARRGGGTALACSADIFIMSKLNIPIPKPLEACVALVKPKNPTGVLNKFICCSFYNPPKSRRSNKLAEFLVATISLLRSQHPGARVILGADINEMKLDVLLALDPTLKQIVRGVTNKNQDKTLDVFVMDCQDLYQRPTILPPMTVDEGKVGKDSDYNGVEALPRTNLAPEGNSMREEVRVQPFPDSGMAEFGCTLLQEDWSMLEGEETSTSMVNIFKNHSEDLVNKQFPFKTVHIGKQDLPYFTEELRRLKRRRQRAYRKGKRSKEYIEAKKVFDDKLLREKQSNTDTRSLKK